MSEKVKNIVIFFGIGILLVVVYLIFLRPKPEEPSLSSSSQNNSVVQDTNTAESSNPPDAGFLPLLLSVQKITLNDAVLNNEAFRALKDNSLPLYNTEPVRGRPNPFAPIGSDNFVSPFDKNQNPNNANPQNTGNNNTQSTNTIPRIPLDLLQSSNQNQSVNNTNQR